MMKKYWYRIFNFIDDWIYPAHGLRNVLFYRYDLIKIPQLKPYEYSDMEYRMLCANMQMIVDFIEKESPEKYICWYKDEKGQEVGHKYGENDEYPILYPELKGKWIMDIIKEIYHWWKEEYPVLLKDEDYILSFWCDNFSGEWKATEKNGTVFYTRFDKIKAKSMKDLENKNIKWNILDKYLDRDKIFEENYVFTQHRKIETDIYNSCQKYLHLCIEVRPYLWT